VFYRDYLDQLVPRNRGVERFIGYDNSMPMLEQARSKIKEHGLENRIEVRFGDLNGDLSKLPLANASPVP
jgi:ubiquinone/menaquinone biosynthesis C-methylase UbiE